MKKIIYLLVLVLLLAGCKSTAKMAVENYLNEYISLSDNVTRNMNEIIEQENLDTSNKDKYVEIFKKQYKDLKYEIISEDYNGDEAIIKTKIIVYDLYKVQNDASKYLANHKEEFEDENNEYDINKYIAYKLDKMQNTNDKVEYTIDFYVVNTSDGWIVSSPSNSDLEKIHGIYNYES